MMQKKEAVTQENLFSVLNLLDTSEIRYWVDGGWGWIYLLGRKREHIEMLI